MHPDNDDGLDTVNPLLSKRFDDESDKRAGGTDDVEELRSDPHVRYLIEYLRRADDPVDLATAATHVAAGVTDTPPEEVSDDVRNRVQTFLHHGHIPKLAEQGALRYDRETNTVALDDD